LKHKFSTPVLTFILVLSAGVVFPILFGFTDKLLRILLVDLNAVALMVSSFAWLLIFYFWGIKFSIEYVTQQFEIADRKKLFKFSNMAFTAVTLIFYFSLISASWLSNILWGSFYLVTVGFFYWLSSKALLSSE
jgi:hypothetical protein